MAAGAIIAPVIQKKFHITSGYDLILVMYMYCVKGAHFVVHTYDKLLDTIDSLRRVR